MRLTEHKDGLTSENKKNPLHKHMELFHKGEQPKFDSSIVNKHQYNLHRPILKSIHIEESQSGSHIAMNSKSEFSRGKLVRVRIET